MSQAEKVPSVTIDNAAPRAENVPNRDAARIAEIVNQEFGPKVVKAVPERPAGEEARIIDLKREAVSAAEGAKTNPEVVATEKGFGDVALETLGRSSLEVGGAIVNSVKWLAGTKWSKNLQIYVRNLGVEATDKSITQQKTKITEMDAQIAKLEEKSGSAWFQFRRRKFEQKASSKRTERAKLDTQLGVLTEKRQAKADKIAEIVRTITDKYDLKLKPHEQKAEQLKEESERLEVVIKERVAQREQLRAQVLALKTEVSKLGWFADDTEGLGERLNNLKKELEQMDRPISELRHNLKVASEKKEKAMEKIKGLRDKISTAKANLV